LKVEFDFADARPEEEILPAWDAGQICLPEELQSRLTTAAELHSTTALKICLQELNQLSPEGRMLAQHIRHLTRSYDMDGILRLICQVTTPAMAGAVSSTHHAFASG
jgi:hypothetical protein